MSRGRSRFIVLLILLLACGVCGCGGGDSTVASGDSVGDDSFPELPRATGPWSPMADGQSGLVKWSLFGAPGVAEGETCMGWEMTSEVPGVAEEIAQMLEVRFKYNEKPIACHPLLEDQWMGYIFPLVRELLPGTENGLIAGLTSPGVESVSVLLGDAMTQLHSEGDYFWGIVPRAAKTFVVRVGGEEATCAIPDLFDGSALGLCAAGSQ